MAVASFAPHFRQIIMPAPHHSLQAGSFSWCSTNSVKALKASSDGYINIQCYKFSRLVMPIIFLFFFCDNLAVSQGFYITLFRRTSGAIATCEISALYHEVFDHSMKLAAFVCHWRSRFVILHRSSITHTKQQQYQCVLPLTPLTTTCNTWSQERCQWSCPMATTRRPVFQQGQEDLSLSKYFHLVKLEVWLKIIS